MLCPQCQAPVTKNTLNEHFVSVHGRKETIVSQAKPGSTPARGKPPSRPTNQKAVKSNPQGAITPEQIERELAAGILRCPDCGKKVKLDLLDKHYQDAHKNRPVFKGKKERRYHSTAPVDRPLLSADPDDESTVSE